MGYRLNENQIYHLEGLAALKDIATYEPLQDTAGALVFGSGFNSAPSL